MGQQFMPADVYLITLIQACTTLLLDLALLSYLAPHLRGVICSCAPGQPYARGYGANWTMKTARNALSRL